MRSATGATLADADVSPDRVQDDRHVSGRVGDAAPDVPVGTAVPAALVGHQPQAVLGGGAQPLLGRVGAARGAVVDHDRQGPVGA